VCWFLEGAMDSNPPSTSISYEYSHDFLRSNMPRGAGADFRWSELPEGTETTTRLLIRRNKFHYIEFYYRAKQAVEGVESNSCTLVAYETAEHWLRPVFVAYPEGDRYSSNVVSTMKHPLALSVHMSLSGTGAMGTYFLFDIRAKPRWITLASHARLRENDFRSEGEFQAAVRQMRRSVEEAQGD
jgi:hypothetical protein